MKIPFLYLFRREKASEPLTAVTPSGPMTVVEKPASERFGKTVMPNTSRFVGLESVANFPLPAGATPAMPSAPRKISLGPHGTITAAPRSADDDIAIAIAERKIAIPLADLLSQIPEALIQTQALDPERRLLFRAAELESGMSTGQPAVALRAVYQQAPEFFSQPVEEVDPRQVALPFGKVLEQFASFQVRPDQISGEPLPQVETPFLQVTLEDQKVFGTSPAPFPKPEPSPIPSISTPTAPEPPAVAAASEIPAPAIPAPVAASQPIAPIRLPVVMKETTGTATTAATAAVAPTPIRLPVSPAGSPSPAKISPNGTGRPALERVPASSGLPVPTSLPSPLTPPPSPRRIAFKTSAPSDDLRPGLKPDEAPLPRPLSPLQEIAAAVTERRVGLPLREVLRGIPPFQLSGPPIDQVPESARIEFAFSIIEPQLSLGRVEVSAAQFSAALPEEFRQQFTLEDPQTAIPLPLHRVLQGLPNETLQLRGDQEEVAVTAAFETPFSQKAAEDVARLKMPSGPIDKVAAPEAVVVGDADGPVGQSQTNPTVQPAAEEIFAPGTASPEKAKPAFKTDDTLDAKGIVGHASRLPAVQACAAVFSDGLSLAGNIPPGYEVDALCAVAPGLMKKITDQIGTARLGSLAGMTLFCTEAAVSFFARGNICLIALHPAGAQLTTELRRQLEHATEELARTYASPARAFLPNNA